jgi:CRISPR-associated exonuclease Cas4
MTNTEALILRVIDIKQWHYCPRVVYFDYCLPDLRPTTYKMQAGIRAGEKEINKEKRRSLKAFGLEDGERLFNFPLHSDQLGLQGVVDMVIHVTSCAGEQWIPVDHKLSKKAGSHFRRQLTAYALMLEETCQKPVPFGFLYLIPTKKAVKVNFNPRLKEETLALVSEIRGTIHDQRMPPGANKRRQCLQCEFMRFCHDRL